MINYMNNKCHLKPEARERQTVCTLQLGNTETNLKKKKDSGTQRSLEIEIFKLQQMIRNVHI